MGVIALIETESNMAATKTLNPRSRKGPGGANRRAAGRKPARRLLDQIKFMGSAEVAEYLNVKPGNLQYIPDLPNPVAFLRATRVWDGDEIRTFAKTWHERRKARARAA